jgi:phage tail-like protein
MPQAETTNYFLLDRRQGHNAVDGWRAESLSNLQIAAAGLGLAQQPSPPVPLTDDAGTFGGLENPTGVAVGPGGVIYVSDSAQHLLYKIVRRKDLPPRAQFFRLSDGPYHNDRFVYIPTVNRVELWPRALGRDPQSYSEVQVICETVWNEVQARRVILSFANGESSSCGEKKCCEDSGGCGCSQGNASTPKAGCGCQDACQCAAKPKTESASIDKEWVGDYPSSLPAGAVCLDSIDYLSCLGGLGNAPRQFNEPRGLAISPAGNLYVADSKNNRIQVFDLRALVLKAIWGKRANSGDLKVEPDVTCLPPADEITKVGQPIAGDGPGQFNDPWDVATDNAGNVYVADKGNHRVQKYDCRTRRFQIIDGATLAAHFFQVLYGPAREDRFVYIPARSRLELWPHALGHDPLDISEVTIISDEVSTTDEARQLALLTIKAKGAGDIFVEYEKAYPATLAAFPQPELKFSSPTHLAIDRQGRIYVVDADTDYVKVLNRKGLVVGHVQFTDDVQGKFKATAVAIDDSGKLVLGGDSGAYRFNVETEHSYYDDFYSAWVGHCRAMIAGGDGKLITVGGPTLGVAEVSPPVGYLKQGTFISRALDSEIEDCQWHKLLPQFETVVPVGTSVKVSTYTSAIEFTPSAIQALADDDWLTKQTNGEDFLIMGGPGRYLWLKIEFRGNGVETPLIQSLKAYFPRQSYLQYLPAIFQADPVSKDFLDRYLSIFESILGGIEEKVDNIWQLFDPNGVPDAPHDFLTCLAGWVDMLFDASWSTETRRSLLRHAPELYRRRGTPAGLKLLLRLALGIDVRVLEHYQLRRWLFLNSQSSLCNTSELYDNCIVKRLQLDECARVGVSELNYTPDPLRDPFFIYAHKFSVYVQAGDVRSELIERMMRYLIEREKPVHTQFDLVKVEPHFRVGMQSTVGLDTHVGAYPRIVLNQCSTLGYDTLLGCDLQEQGPAMLQVGERARVGVSAVVG